MIFGFKTFSSVLEAYSLLIHDISCFLRYTRSSYFDIQILTLHITLPFTHSSTLLFTRLLVHYCKFDICLLLYFLWNGFVDVLVPFKCFVLFAPILACYTHTLFLIAIVMTYRGSLFAVRDKMFEAITHKIILQP